MGKSGRQMFYGSYSHNLDNKGRLVVPSKMRDELGAKAYILKGYDGCLSIYKEADFMKLMEKINSLSFTKKSARLFIRAQLDSVCELEIDRQGSALLPTSLLNRYSIGKEVVGVGVYDHIEVWNKSDYEEFSKTANSSFEENAEELEDND